MPSPITRSMLTPPVSDEIDHILGATTAPVTLAEFGDYECPHCGRAHGILKVLMDRAPNGVRLVFRNFPLTQLHPYAQAAAEAAEAAGAQGKFWEMHDMLFENQNALEDEDLLAYASELGLDMTRFQTEILQGTHAARVREDVISGVRSGVNGTPTFFINGLRHDGPWDLASLSAAIVENSVPHGDAHRPFLR